MITQLTFFFQGTVETWNEINSRCYNLYANMFNSVETAAIYLAQHEVTVTSRFVGGTAGDCGNRYTVINRQGKVMGRDLNSTSFILLAVGFNWGYVCGLEHLNEI